MYVASCPDFQERDPIERIRKVILAYDLATEKELKVNFLFFFEKLKAIYLTCFHIYDFSALFGMLLEVNFTKYFLLYPFFHASRKIFEFQCWECRSHNEIRWET